MTKLCPLHPAPIEGSGSTIFAPCVEEQCAWFDGNECAIRGLSSIAESLYDIQKEYQKSNTVYEESYDEPSE
jgi:hypothetical protein